MLTTCTDILSAPTSAYNIPERMLHYLWRTKQIGTCQPATTTNQSIELIDWGQYNAVHAGPDFTNARIRINGLEWVGHIEIHELSSEWLAHRHHLDPAYDQVILHVVWEDDKPVYNSSGELLPCLELSNYINPQDLKHLLKFVSAQSGLPCHYGIGHLPQILLQQWKTRLLIERLDAHYSTIKSRLHQVSGDWEQVAYEKLTRAMGFHTHSASMVKLAQHLSWSMIRKHLDDRDGLIALLLGRAGLLHKLSEDVRPHYEQLYEYLTLKYRLLPLYGLIWHYRGVRPHNHPHIRLLQLAHILHRIEYIMQRIVDASSLSDLFKIVQCDSSDSQFVRLARSAQCSVLINAILPLRYAYTRWEGVDDDLSWIIEAFESLPGDRNRIVLQYADAGIATNSALDTQALIQSHQFYCAQKACLDCPIGHKLLRI